jgi:2-polyprenyl-6-methoxyphenol hydroxylase-like FAD-dependent oxidoreductase
VAELRNATVVGGGIAGLASAVSLAQAGWQATVLERAPEFGEVGGGWRQSARNAVLRLAPPRLLVRAGTQIVDWTAP